MTYQEQAAARTALAAAQVESTRVAIIHGKYIQCMRRNASMYRSCPAADNKDSGHLTSALNTFIRRSAQNILWLADFTGAQRFDFLEWVDGWQVRLHEALHSGINCRSPDTAAARRQILDGFMVAMDPNRTSGGGRLGFTP